MRRILSGILTLFFALSLAAQENPRALRTLMNELAAQESVICGLCYGEDEPAARLGAFMAFSVQVSAYCKDHKLAIPADSDLLSLCDEITIYDEGDWDVMMYIPVSDISPLSTGRKRSVKRTAPGQAPDISDKIKKTPSPKVEFRPREGLPPEPKPESKPQPKPEVQPKIPVNPLPPGREDTDVVERMLASVQQWYDLRLMLDKYKSQGKISDFQFLRALDDARPDMHLVFINPDQSIEAAFSPDSGQGREEIYRHTSRSVEDCLGRRHLLYILTK